MVVSKIGYRNSNKKVTRKMNKDSFLEFYYEKLIVDMGSAIQIRIADPFENYSKKIWLPTSKVKYDEDEMKVWIPQWLAEKNYLI